MTSVPSPTRSGQWLAAAFVLLASAIGGLWHAETRFLEETALRERGRELQAIADLKIEYIRFWLEIRLGNATVPGRSQLISRAAEFGLDRDSPSTRTSVTERLTTIQSTYGYNAVMLLDQAGQVRIEIGNWDDNTRRHALASARKAIQLGKPRISPAYESVAGGRPHLDIDIAAPVFAVEPSTPRIVGALVLHLDSRAQLDPLLRRWPSQSESGETILVERAGDKIIYLSTLRHAEAANWQWNTDDPKLPAAMAARGQRGVVAGVDYRGVPVLAAIGQVPGVPWALVAKLDQAEILAPVRQEALRSGVLYGLFLLALGLSMLAWHRRRNGELILANEIATRQALQSSEARFRKVLEHAWDFHALFNREMKICYSSPSIAHFLGQQALGSSIGVGTARVHPDDVAAVEDARRRALQQPGFPQRVQHRFSRRDGSWMTVETLFTNYFDDPDIGALSFVSRDISAQVAVEMALRESESRYRIFFQLSPDAVFVHRGNVIFMANEAATRFFRAGSTESLVGRNWHDLVAAEQWPLIEARVALLESDTIAFLPPTELTYRALDGTTIHVEATAARIIVEGTPAILSVVRDITERREAEAARLELARQHRDALVREVHHRIKNHLQGLAGLLNQHRRQYPAQNDALEAIGAQIAAISVIHGLQGRESSGEVRMYLLLREIATFLGSRAALEFANPGNPDCHGCAWRVVDEESVPVALVINELVTNAIKHQTGPADGQPVPVRIDCACNDERVVVTVRNPGSLPAAFDFAAGSALGTGLTLVRSLLSHKGATLTIAAAAGMVESRLTLSTPVVSRKPGDHVVSLR